MGYIYAISDVHGFLDVFKETLENVDLKDKNNRLILLGDYINGGDKNCETLYYIKELSENYPNQVIVLMGNHERVFLDDLNSKFSEWNFDEFINYIPKKEYEKITEECIYIPNVQMRLYTIYKYVTKQIKVHHKEMINWLKKLPYYYETENQIFVHAGIDEEAGEDWKKLTNKDCYLWKYPHQEGAFYKDIIAGHIHTSIISKDKDFHNVYWDKKNHFYIDGDVKKNRFIPLLKYDIKTKVYSSFDKVMNTDESFTWSEYIIK